MAKLNLPKLKQNEGQDAAANKTESKTVKSKKKYLVPKDINFYERYQTIVEGKQKQIDPKMFFVPLLSVLIVMLGIFAFFKISTMIINKDNEEITSFLNSSENLSAYNESLKLQDEIALTNRKISNIKLISDTAATYPQLNTATSNLIIDATAKSSVSLSSINYMSGTGAMAISGVTGTGNANLAKNVSAYVKALKDTNLFSTVSYTGYAGDTENGYTFVITGILK